ncbi:uncharacterized protein BDFB_007333 [Asbolus verrucosus]|uniref:LRR 8 domain containing protein n=1 Tax=Asbolus verrucosus TaxID=1661398 RepID=A0A482VXV3_ASBVE|nr:uncharacterized protein BDFB_007333 [Asbolus verrucosus]
MKTQEAEVIVSLLFVLSSFGSAVLTGYEQHRDGNIADDTKFGCTWQGGTTSALKCTCREDAEEMNITKNSISSYETSAIEIDGCKNVRFGDNSIIDMRNLRNINLKNIRSLQLAETSLTWYGTVGRNQYEERLDLSIPSLSIKIENCNITQISGYTFQGRINTIHFENVIIDNIDPFAFNALMKTENIIMRNVELRNVREQPFKKFTTKNFELNGVRAQLIPSRFVNNVTVYGTFEITNCILDTVRPGGFIVFNPLKFEVTDTRINHLDGEAFKVTTRGDVLFKNNIFNVINDGAFAAIDLNEDETASDATITFDSNVFTTLTRDSLTVNEDFRPKFSNLNINETCDCKSIDHNIKDAEFYSEIKCLFENQFVTVENYKSEMCSIIQSYSTVIIIVGVVFTLCVIIVTVLVVYYKKVYRSKKYGNEKNSKKGNMSLIVPDGRTYRETELHVIVERADLLTTDL